MKKWKKNLMLATGGIVGLTTAVAYGFFSFAIKRRPYPEEDLDSTLKKVYKDSNDEKCDGETVPKENISSKSRLSKEEKYAKKLEMMKKEYAEIKRDKPWFDEQKCEIVEIKSFDGLKLYGKIVYTAKPSDKYVIAIHGYRCYGEREYIPYAKFFIEHGYNMIIPDDRSHGKSEGKYIGMGYLDHFDCMKWIEYAVNRFGDEAKIVLYGKSMGAATVMITSGEDLPEQVKVVVEDCGYSSTYDEFKHNLKTMFPVKLPEFPILPASNLVCRIKAGYSFKQASPIEGVKKTKLPMLFIHGSADSFVPTWMVYDLYDACNTPKELLVVEGAEHVQSHVLEPDIYEKKVLEFVDQYTESNKNDDINENFENKDNHNEDM